MSTYDLTKTTVSVKVYNTLLRILNNWFTDCFYNPVYIVHRPNSFISLKTKIKQLHREPVELYDLMFDVKKVFEVDIDYDEMEKYEVVEQLLHRILDEMLDKRK